MKTRAAWMRAVSAIAALFVAIVVATPARAADRRLERSAQAALRRAEKDYVAGSPGDAGALLDHALRACGANGCERQTVALLYRDAALVGMETGDLGAIAGLSRALEIDPTLQPNPTYDSAKILAAWPAAREEALARLAPKPTGDFSHTPANEQAERTPLPIYVEALSGQGIQTVVVKYQATGMKSFERITLPRLGRGWGGLIPCGRVVRGAMRYFIQGFDERGEPVANTGDPKHAFAVPIRAEISGTPPSLPGKPPPRQCGSEAEEDEAPTPEPGSPVAAPVEGERTRGFARIWVGLSAGVDFTLLPAAPGACKLANGQPITTPAYYCTTPDGQDFPARPAGAENDTLPGGGSDGAGSVGGGVTSGSERVMVSLDYAISASFLVGLRAGYVIGGYPGQAAGADGHAFTTPIHLELRATYIFGHEPLTRSGFAPVAFLGGGVSSFDADEVVLVTQSGIAGQRPIRAWRTGGPGMADLGGGLRYAFSQRVATTLLLKAAGFFGGSGLVPAAGPELGVAVGF